MSIKMQNSINNLSEALAKTLMRVVELEQRIQALESKTSRKPRTKTNG
jgi:BMFP domain-containing protein YqiC